VADTAAFEAAYGAGLPIAGQWQSGDKLSNGGENLKLSLGLGTAIHEFDYDDTDPWPVAADGAGYSLTLGCLESGTDHALASSWRASVALGGSPGTSDGVALSDWLTSNGLVPGQELTDLDADGRSALFEYAAGTDPNTADGHDTLAVEQVGDELRLSVRRERAADGVEVSSEYSSDLTSWVPAQHVSTSSAGDGTDSLHFAPPEGATGDRQFMRIRIETK
jgi:hypothetical protein